MWPFRRKLPEVTNESYSRWLRAHRPPWLMFLGLPVLQQEQLALLGDQFTNDVAIAFGYANVNPQLAEAGVAAAHGDPEGEETLARQVAVNLASKILGRMPPKAASRFAGPAETMAGFGERRNGADRAMQTSKDAARQFLGRRPDAKAAL